MKVSRSTLRKMINEMIDDPYEMDPNVQQSGPISREKSPWMYDPEPALRGPSSTGQKPAQQTDEDLIDQFLLDIADVYKLGPDQAGLFVREVKKALKPALTAARGAADDDIDDDIDDDMGEF